MAKERVEVEYSLKDNASKGINGIGGRFGKLIKIMSNPVLVGGAIAVGLLKLGKSAITASAQLEQYQISAPFENILF